MLTQIFNYEGAQVRTVVIDNEPWLVAKDLCDILEISNPTVAIQRLDADEVTKFNLGGLHGEVNIVNEYGMYSLILGSRKAEARAFKRWVTHEVLPQIRKTGTYGNQIPQSYSEALRLAANLSEENEKLQIESQINAPKVALYEVAISAKNNLTMNAVAKSLGYGRNKLFDFLREQKVLMKNNLPYETYVQRGYFDVRQYTITHFTESLENKTQTLVTPKGMAWIHDLLVKNGRVSA